MPVCVPVHRWKECWLTTERKNVKLVTLLYACRQSRVCVCVVFLFQWLLLHMWVRFCVTNCRCLTEYFSYPDDDWNIQYEHWQKLRKPSFFTHARMCCWVTLVRADSHKVVHVSCLCCWCYLLQSTMAVVIHLVIIYSCPDCCNSAIDNCTMCWF